jgi:hypothetical protein
MEQQYFLDKYDYFQVKELTGQYKANFAKKLQCWGLKAGDSDNFFYKCVLWFYGFNDGIILNMKFGGWLMVFSRY